MSQPETKNLLKEIRLAVLLEAAQKLSASGDAEFRQWLESELQMEIASDPTRGGFPSTSEVSG